MAKRPEYQHVLEPLDPAPFLDRGAPLGDDAFDVRAPAVFEPLGRFLVVLADEGVGDGVNEFRVRRHVVLPSAKIRSGRSRRLSPSPYRNDLHPLASTPDGGVGQRCARAVRRGRPDPVGVGPRQTGVDRTPPRRGHAPVETPADSTVAVERWTGPKRGGRLPARPDSGPARTERPRPRPQEAWTTGASQRALALEPGCFRYAYRPGHAARRCDVTRSLENHMKTITSVARTRERAACSLRKSRTGASNPPVILGFHAKLRI